MVKLNQRDCVGLGFLVSTIVASLGLIISARKASTDFNYLDYVYYFAEIPTAVNVSVQANMARGEEDDSCNCTELINIIGKKTHVFANLQHALHTTSDLSLFQFTDAQTQLIQQQLDKAIRRQTTPDDGLGTLHWPALHLVLPHRDFIEQTFLMAGRLYLLSVRTALFLYKPSRYSAQFHFVLFMEDNRAPRMQNSHYQGKMPLYLIRKTSVTVHASLMPDVGDHNESDLFTCRASVHPLEHYIVYHCQAAQAAHPLSFQSLSNSNACDNVTSAYFHISINNWTNFTVPLHSVAKHRPRSRLVQCVRPLYGSVKRFCLHIHELIAHGLAVSGIQHFIFYSRVASVPECLQPYINEGVASLVYYPEMGSKAFRDPMNDNSYDQSLQMADCTMRNLEAEFVLHADFDEYLTFAGEVVDNRMEALHQCSMIEKLQEKIECMSTHNAFASIPERRREKLQGALITRNIFYPTEFRNPSMGGPYAVYEERLALEWRSFVEPQEQEKVLARPSMTWNLSPHVAWAFGEERLSSGLDKLVTLRHYRHHIRSHPRIQRTDDSYEKYGLIIRQVAQSSRMRLALANVQDQE